MISDGKRICLIARVGVAPRPDIICCAKALAQRGWQVDVLAGADAPLPEYAFPEPAIAIRKWRRPAADDGPLGRLRNLYDFCRWVMREVRRERYAYLIGFDPDGLIAAGLASRRCGGTPYLYYSLELYTEAEMRRPDQRLKKLAERWFNHRAIASVVHDARRESVLRRLNRLGPGHPVYRVPNAPLLGSGGSSGRADYVQRRLAEQGVERPRTVALYHGGLGDLTMVAEVAESVGDWPPGCMFFVHGWGSAEYLARLRAIAARHRPPRVVVSTDFLPYEELDGLTASAHVGIALYRDVGTPNVFEMASGKLYQYMKHGLPVITNDFPNLRAVVERHSVGLCIDSTVPGSIAAAVRALVADGERYRCCAANARAAFARHFAYEPNFAPLAEMLEERIGQHRSPHRRGAAVSLRDSRADEKVECRAGGSPLCDHTRGAGRGTARPS